MDSHDTDSACNNFCGPEFRWMFYRGVSPEGDTPFCPSDATEEGRWEALNVKFFGSPAFVTDEDIRISCS